jgi:recombination protein RecA
MSQKNPVSPAAANDKQKALDAALSQIERAFGKGSIMRMGTDYAPPVILR